jgi:NADH-quinone oxidoreductase subunit D
MHGRCASSSSSAASATCAPNVQIRLPPPGFERCAAGHVGSQCFPYVDRGNYVSPMLNNVGCRAGVRETPRDDGAGAVPVVSGGARASRPDLADHLTLNARWRWSSARHPVPVAGAGAGHGTGTSSRGCGARAHHSFGASGGMAHPPTAEFAAHAAAVVPFVLRVCRRGGRGCCSQPHLSPRCIGSGNVRPDATLARLDRARAAARVGSLRRPQGQPLPPH